MNLSEKLSQEKFVEMMNQIYTIGHLSQSVNTKDLVQEIIVKINEVIKGN
ncbi:hypothetical protein [Bacillus sp. T3]|nr:hypothetical protein [Bacillus sp. T3]